MSDNRREQFRKFLDSSGNSDVVEEAVVEVPTEKEDKGVENKTPVETEHKKEESTQQAQDDKELKEEGVSEGVKEGGSEDEELQFGTVEYFDEDNSDVTEEINTEESTGEEEPSKIKYNLSEYIKEHEGTLEKYFTLKNINPDELDEVSLVKYKLSKENPYWTEQDIDEEIRDRYGVGLRKKEIDRDNMLEEEIKEAERYNDNIESKLRRGERALKAEASKASELIKSEKESITIPEIELEYKGNSKEADLESYLKEQETKQKEYLESEWIPNVTKASNSVGGFKQSVKIQIADDVEVDTGLTYKFTDTQRKKLSEYMETYVGQPSDSKYVNSETGEVDYKGLVNQKAKELFADQIIQAGIKEGIAKFREEYIKRYQVNYSDDPRPNRQPSNTVGGMDDYFNKRAQSRKGRGRYS